MHLFTRARWNLTVGGPMLASQRRVWSRGLSGWGRFQASRPDLQSRPHRDRGSVTGRRRSSPANSPSLRSFAERRDHVASWSHGSQRRWNWEQEVELEQGRPAASASRLGHWVLGCPACGCAQLPWNRPLAGEGAPCTVLCGPRGTIHGWLASRREKERPGPPQEGVAEGGPAHGNIGTPPTPPHHYPTAFLSEGGFGGRCKRALTFSPNSVQANEVQKQCHNSGTLLSLNLISIDNQAACPTLEQCSHGSSLHRLPEVGEDQGAGRASDAHREPGTTG